MYTAVAPYFSFPFQKKNHAFIIALFAFVNPSTQQLLNLWSSFIPTWQTWTVLKDGWIPPGCQEISGIRCMWINACSKTGFSDLCFYPFALTCPWHVWKQVIAQTISYFSGKDVAGMVEKGRQGFWNPKGRCCFQSHALEVSPRWHCGMKCRLLSDKSRFWGQVSIRKQVLWHKLLVLCASSEWKGGSEI